MWVLVFKGADGGTFIFIMIRRVQLKRRSYLTNNTDRVREIVDFNRTEWKVKEPITLKVCGDQPENMLQGRAHFQGFYRTTPC